ncbi:hypothetical protein HO133_004699 [Letharia lupina]|uniref:CST complex subunit Stn1 N-terminal domain-containing protein n=1 Tax=Letharia lupina TaxID=560253 RepID=A0A8H6KZY8_9LECA|nr:uncharacterized protein HO133_004699 [Letharia lupina]KAF6230357.1 hypothetical protein HO133_004699 [Letharia lupina]
MPNPLPAPLTFYPAYCFSLSPTHNTWARLTAADVHALRERTGFEGQNLFFHLNHPIKWIRLVGVIVAVDLYPTRWIALLDDSSGATIEITCGRPAPTPTAPNANSTSLAEGSAGLGRLDAFDKGVTATGRDVDLSGVDIGSVVKVKGGVGLFREVRQMLLERISIIRTTNEEAAAWAENTAFRKEILSQPWVVSEEEEKRARRKAEGLDREKQARKERKKRKLREEYDGKRAVAEKEKRRAERKRREEGQGRREGEAGPLGRQADGEHRKRRRDVEKARRPKSEDSGA